MTTPATLAAATGLDPDTLTDLVRTTSRPDYGRWHHQVTRTGGCAAPIRMRGWTRTTDRRTGVVLHRFSTHDQPDGVLRLACGNRRASRCPSCAATYSADTYHLIRAGLVGGTKGVGTDVRTHPRVFATFTAPSFGPVHNRPDRGTCRCGTHHPDNAEVLGTPLDPDRYDYAGAVLWNNHAGDLWRRFGIYLRREVAARVGITQTALKTVARVSYAKVAEFQRRGAVHFHAVIRIDGPEGTDDPPPPWARVGLLDDAIRAAVRRVAVAVPAAGPHPARALHWGTQLDVRPIKAFGAGTDLTEQAVASYVAKYATKAAENTGTVDRRVGSREALDLLGVPPHPRRLIEACFDLDRHYPEHRLTAWSHMLGFRGHFATKSRRYSITLTEIRTERADYRAAEQRAALGLPDPDDPDAGMVLTLAHWVYAGQGHTPGESLLARTIADDLREIRRLGREEHAHLIATEGAPA